MHAKKESLVYFERQGEANIADLPPRRHHMCAEKVKGYHEKN